MAARRGTQAIAAVDVKNTSTRDNFVPFVSEHMPGHLTWLRKDQCSSVRVAEEGPFLHWEHPELPLQGKAPAVLTTTEL